MLFRSRYVIRQVEQVENNQPFNIGAFYINTHPPFFTAPDCPKYVQHKSSTGFSDHLHSHLQSIHCVDHAVGMILQTLKKRGLMGNTVVVVVGDTPGHDHEKGQLLSPRNNDINYNLNFVRNQIRDRIIPPDNFFLISFYRAIIEKLTLLDLLATSGLIFFILGIVFIAKDFDFLSNRITSLINTILLFLIISNGIIMLDKYWDVL